MTEGWPKMNFWPAFGFLSPLLRKPPPVGLCRLHRIPAGAFAAHCISRTPAQHLTEPFWSASFFFNSILISNFEDI